MAKIIEGSIYTFNPNKQPQPRYHPDFAFKILDYVEKHDKVYLVKLMEPKRIIIKNKAIIENYWYMHTEKEIETYNILYGANNVTG